MLLTRPSKRSSTEHVTCAKAPPPNPLQTRSVSFQHRNKKSRAAVKKIPSFSASLSSSLELFSSFFLLILKKNPEKKKIKPTNNHGATLNGLLRLPLPDPVADGVRCRPQHSPPPTIRKRTNAERTQGLVGKLGGLLAVVGRHGPGLADIEGLWGRAWRGSWGQWRKQFFW